MENMMIGGGQYYGGQLAQEGSNARMVQTPTIAQRLDMAVKQAEERLAATKRAKELFEKNPDLEELLNIMQRAHF